MRVIIIGAGFTGVQVARKLLEQHHRVVLIDSDVERVRDVGNQLDCTVMRAQGNSMAVLEKAGIASASALVAVTASDEVNMVACALADADYPQVTKIASVRNYEYYTDLVGEAARSGDGRRPPFGIDWMVNPDVEAARAVSRALAHGAVGGVLEIGRGVGIVTLTVGATSPLNGLEFRQLSTVEGWRHLVAFLERGDEVMLPDGATVLKAGDRIGVVARLEDVAAIAALCAAGSGTVSTMAVLGADRIGSLIVQDQCGEDGRSAAGRFFGAWREGPRMDIAVIDEASERCKAVAARFRGVRVFCGDATDEDLVREENIDSCDLAVAVSRNYDRNLVSAAYLKSRGVKRTIALTENSDVAVMAQRLGVDVAVPMRETVVDSIAGRLRGRNVTGVHTVCGGAFEIVECVVAEGAEAADKPLRELDIGGSGLVLMVSAADGPSPAPGGGTIVPVGASVVLIVPAGDSRVVEMFAG